MSKTITYLLIALAINILLAFIMYRIHREELPFNVNSLGYIAGYALIYWLRPFLFVGVTRLFYLMTNRKFTRKAAISVYAIAWTVMLIGMLYI